MPEVLTGSLTDVIIISVLYVMSADDLKQSEEMRITESFLYILKSNFSSLKGENLSYCILTA